MQYAQTCVNVIPCLHVHTQAGRLDARGLLKLVGSLLTAQGATCTEDLAQWRVVAALPVPAAGGGGGQDPASGGGGGGGDGTRCTAAGAADAGVQAGAMMSEPSRNGSTTPTAGVSSPAAVGGLVQAAKKARGAPGIEAQVAVSQSAVSTPPTEAGVRGSGGAGAVSVRVSVFQLQKGRLEVSASVAKGVSDAHARAFTAALRKVQADVEVVSAG
jgi:hypothetical protein